MARLRRPRGKRNPYKAAKPIGVFSAKRPVKRQAIPAQAAKPAPVPIEDPYAWQTPDYQLNDANAWRKKENSNLDLVYKRDRALRDAGYEIDAASGSLKQIDISLNPYSRAALMKKAYDQSLRRNTAGAAAQGQLYAGSLDRAQVGASSNYTAQQNSLLTGLYDLMAGTEAGIAGNQSDYQDALANSGLLGLGDAQKQDLTEMGEATPGTKGKKPVYGRSPRSYQKQIIRIRKRQPKSKARAKRVQTLIKKRNAATRALRS